MPNPGHPSPRQQGMPLQRPPAEFTARNASSQERALWGQSTGSHTRTARTLRTGAANHNCAPRQREAGGGSAPNPRQPPGQPPATPMALNAQQGM